MISNLIFINIIDVFQSISTDVNASTDYYLTFSLPMNPISTCEFNILFNLLCANFSLEL